MQRRQGVLCVLPEHTRTALRRRPVSGWLDWPRAPTAALGRTSLQLAPANVAHVQLEPFLSLGQARAWYAN
jgi:hypothetical protein